MGSISSRLRQHKKISCSPVLRGRPSKRCFPVFFIPVESPAHGCQGIYCHCPESKGIAGFSPIRQAINLCFVNADQSPVTSFTQAFKLRIHYTKEDLAVAGGAAQLKLAYYAGGKWTVLACTAEPDNPDDAGSEGYLLVSRSTWPADPPVALGN